MLAALLCSCKGGNGEGEITTVDGNSLTPTPEEITLTWENGFVGSFDNFGDRKTLSQLAYSGSFVEAEGYITSEYIKLEGKGVTLTVHSAVDMTDEKVFVVSHYKDNGDGTYSLDRRAPQFKPCELVCSSDGKIVYTSSADSEIIRISLKGTDIPKTEVCNASAPGSTAKLDSVYTMPESGQSIVTGVELSFGSVGSINNTNGYKMILDYSDSAFKVTQNILIPKKGTTLTYTVSGEYSAEVAALTSWYLDSDGMYKLNMGAPNFNAVISGKDTIQTAANKTSHTFTYTTSFDNEMIRLCVPAENQTLSIDVSYNENYFKGTFDRLYTDIPSKAELISDIVWIPGYVTSPHTQSNKKGLITIYSVTDNTDVRADEVLEDYIVSEPINIPKKGTTVTVTVPNPARDDIAVLSSCGENNTVDYSKAVFIGNPVSGNTVFETYNSKDNTSTYKYITSEDNESIRFTFKKGRTSYIPIVTFREMSAGTVGTWQSLVSEIESSKRESLENTKGLSSENISALDVSWNNGYVSTSGSVIKSSGNYLYSDVVHLEKAGTVIYFMDTSKIGSDEYTYLGTEGLVFSFWNSDGSKIMNNPKGVTSQDVDTYITKDGNFRVFRYTSRSDNEYVRLSVRASQSIPNLPQLMSPVFVTDQTVMISAGESDVNIKLEGKDVACKVSVFEGYSPDNYCALLITDDETVYNTAKSARLEKTVCVYTKADEKALAEVYAYFTTAYPINGERTYYVGSSKALDSYVTAALTPEKATADTLAALVKTQSKGNYYAGILDGLTMHAIGDSYFQGSGLGTYYTWPSLIAKKYNMLHVNYGIGGSTIANVSTNNPMVIRYTAMASGHADIIILEGGRNDRNKSVPYGEFDSKDNKTLCGALNIMIAGLHQKYPEALIILVTPWNYKDSSGGVTYSYAMKMVEYQKQLGLDYVKIINAADPNISGVDMNDITFRQKYSKKVSDISHLNAKGMDLVFPKMELQVAKLYAEFKGITLTDNGDVK